MSRIKERLDLLFKNVPKEEKDVIIAEFNESTKGMSERQVLSYIGRMTQAIEAIPDNRTQQEKEAFEKKMADAEKETKRVFDELRAKAEKEMQKKRSEAPNQSFEELFP